MARYLYVTIFVFFALAEGILFVCLSNQAITDSENKDLYLNEEMGEETVNPVVENLPKTTTDTEPTVVPEKIEPQVVSGILEQQIMPTNKINNVRWGAYVGYTQTELTSFEKLVGDTVDMRGVFVDWGDSFPTEFSKSLKSDGKVVVIYWEQYGVTLDEIISGKSDSYIESFATDAQAYGGEIILAPLHEMNGDWDPWGGFAAGNSPAKVVETWKHIVTVFGKVPNVKFAWTVNNVSEPNTPENTISHYYPGDEYVDYVAVDGFNFGNPWQTFDEIFGTVLVELKQYHKPIYILSMGSSEGTKKADWITDALTVQLAKYPEIEGWIWFNENKERDWRVNSDPESLAAFSAALK